MRGRRSARARALAIVSAWLVAASGWRVHAEPSAEPPAATAEVTTEEPADDPTETFERAETLYDEGRYAEAIELLRELLRDYPDPILLYNLGRAYEGADRIAEAIDAYERYLDAAPDAPDRDAIARRIERLRVRLRPQAPADPTPPPATIVPPPKPPRPIVAPWVVAGIGGAGLVAGATLGGLSWSRRDAAIDAMIQADAAAHLGRAQRLATAANVAFGIGGALAIAGVAWGVAQVVKRRRARERNQARVGS
jgi:tetratricopeptide (TPR) repeat protein